MKLRIFAAMVLIAMLLGVSVTAFAQYYKPKAYVEAAESDSAAIYGTTVSRLFLNDGPGTRRFFKELGSYNSKAGERVHILAKAWDPNNGIWWLKVEYPTGSGFTGWTGLKRFDTSTFDLEAVPTETWYDY